MLSLILPLAFAILSSSPQSEMRSLLQVRFAPAFLSFIPAVWGDYQIIALGTGYEYAMVGTPDRKCLWILSRQPGMDPALYAQLKEQAKAEGFDVAALVETPHKPQSQIGKHS